MYKKSIQILQVIVEELFLIIFKEVYPIKLKFYNEVVLLVQFDIY